MPLKSSADTSLYISFLGHLFNGCSLKSPVNACTACHLALLIVHWPLTSILDHFNNPAILPLSDSTVIGQTLVSPVIWEEYIEELLWFSWASLCIVYRVCLIALCPNQRVQAGSAGVYRDALCCGLSQRAKNIHSTHGSEGEPIHSSVNTHIVGVLHLRTRDLWPCINVGVCIWVCVCGRKPCLSPRHR